MSHQKIFWHVKIQVFGITWLFHKSKVSSSADRYISCASGTFSKHTFYENIIGRIWALGVLHTGHMKLSWIQVKRHEHRVRLAGLLSQGQEGISQDRWQVKSMVFAPESQVPQLWVGEPDLACTWHWSIGRTLLWLIYRNWEGAS